MSTTTSTTATALGRTWSPATRYRRSLWLLTSRDLRVRYSTSALGWVWSILDPLLMAGIYWFVFTQVFQRGINHEPYIVFLMAALLPWTWFTGAIGDSTKAFTRDAKLIRSTTIPRSIWVTRIVLSKGIEFLLSLPVLALFIVASQFTSHPAVLNWQLVYFVPAIILQAVLTVGIGLIVAPLVVFFRDLERAVRLILRLAFYASPIIFSLDDLRRVHPAFELIGSFNPLTGIMSLYRAGLFPKELDWFSIAISAGMTVVLLMIGLLVFRRCLPAVLKEI
ncbi:ABC transporter permease [Schumannella luteola]|uniref:Transport permease protein n=1 Tax=Schumannella luteola TaxID=472059 RepID=A0A852YK58_9MICO|nr:ABC-2 type transport system permease protein [Schumannella luteola]TPX03873.1 ABC transporter permease [Schumannella luteola]